MANLQVKNVPGPIHRKLRALAKRRGTTVREIVLRAVGREISDEEFRERLAARTPVNLGVPAWRLIEEERAEREAGLAKASPEAPGGKG
ncbi:MAG: toxin-antitoxin system HicB family antitoxin [Myxococcales bacterium]|nr:toxin-antitoxin system HicB family antitoxin [Myxococcales bacterium]